MANSIENGIIPNEIKYEAIDAASGIRMYNFITVKVALLQRKRYLCNVKLKHRKFYLMMDKNYVLDLYKSGWNVEDIADETGYEETKIL